MLENFLREYNVNRVFLSIIGLWPFQNKLVKNFLWTFWLLIGVCYYPFEILLLYDHSDDAQLIFDGCFQIFVSIAVLSGQLNGFFYQDKFQWMYEAINEHWNIFIDDVEIRIMKEYSALSKKFVKYYMIFLYCALLEFIFLPLTPIFLDSIMPLNESRPRFFLVEVEFRVNKDEYFIPIFCYVSLIAIMATSVLIGLDTTHIVCSAHVCSLFAIVSNQIENIILKVDNNNDTGEGKYSMTKELDSFSEEIIYREYIICLKKHQLAIKFADTLNSSNRRYALIILVLIIGAMNLIGLRIIDVLDNLGILMKFVLLFLAVLCTMMITCYSGQRIMDESQNIFHGAYAAEWYKFSPRLKSLLIITLYRSNVPCELKGGNMISLSIATFATVIRMSMSYFATLLSLQE